MTFTDKDHEMWLKALGKASKGALGLDGFVTQQANGC